MPSRVTALVPLRTYTPVCLPSMHREPSIGTHCQSVPGANGCVLAVALLTATTRRTTLKAVNISRCSCTAAAASSKLKRLPALDSQLPSREQKVRPPFGFDHWQLLWTTRLLPSLRYYPVVGVLFTRQVNYKLPQCSFFSHFLRCAWPRSRGCSTTHANTHPGEPLAGLREMCRERFEEIVVINHHNV